MHHRPISSFCILHTLSIRFLCSNYLQLPSTFKLGINYCWINSMFQNNSRFQSSTISCLSSFISFIFLNFCLCYLLILFLPLALTRLPNLFNTRSSNTSNIYTRCLDSCFKSSNFSIRDPCRNCSSRFC